MEQNEHTASRIKIAAVITAAPRWVGALLAAEGLTIPATWDAWWIWLSALAAVGMAIVEGIAFAYVFTAIRTAKDNKSNKWLPRMAALTALVFVIVIAPYVAASVSGVAMSELLSAGWSLWLWSSAVGASTILIVASVGFAERTTPSRNSKPIATQQQTGAAHKTAASKKKTVACEWCGRNFAHINGVNAHKATCEKRPASTIATQNGHPKPDHTAPKTAG